MPLAILTSWLALFGPGIGLGRAAEPDDAAAFFDALNASRTEAGAGLVGRAGDLDDVAANHARTMAAQGQIFHNPDLQTVVANWQVVGENVGVGPNVGSIHQAFLDSPTHHRNIVDPRFVEAGIGVAYAGGRVWVVEVYRKPMPAAAPSPEPQAVAAAAPAPEPVLAPEPAAAAAPAAPPPPPAAPTAPRPRPRPAPVVATPAAAPQPVAAAEPAPAPAPLALDPGAVVEFGAFAAAPPAEDVVSQPRLQSVSVRTAEPFRMPRPSIPRNGLAAFAGILWLLIAADVLHRVRVAANARVAFAVAR